MKGRASRHDGPHVSTVDRGLSAVGIVAALVVVLLVNFLAGRHYRRWDATTSRMYTLSEATTQTLESLQQPVEVDVLLSSTDPLRQSIDDLLKVYRGHTSRLRIRYVDPDRHPAEFAAMQQRYGIEAGQTQDGRVIADTAVVVASGDRHWFITPDDLVSIEEDTPGYTKSKIEQALTVGLRSVLDPKRVRVCFASGHGEYSPDDISNRGLSELRRRLTKDNDDTSVLNLTRGDVDENLGKCDLLVIASPSTPYEPKLQETLLARSNEGLDFFLLLGAISNPDEQRLLPTGLEKLASSYGVRVNNDVVFERSPEMIVPRGAGEVFLPELKSHPITKALLGPAAAVAAMRVVVRQSRSFDIENPEYPRPLLQTSSDAFGMVDYFDWVRAGGEPKPGPHALKGPRIVGIAAARGESTDDRESRFVAFGTPAVAWNENFRNPARHGNALLIDSTLSWLTSKPPIVDVPAKIAPAAELHITDESLGEILRYVLLFMPLSALLLGLAVRLRRTNKSRSRPNETKKKDDRESTP